jgi:hypothetical protein
VSEQQLSTFGEFLATGIKVRSLTDPLGAGGAFLVLDQKR